MSPLLPKHWNDDPGHIHDHPGPPEAPTDQEELGVPGVSDAASRPEADQSQRPGVKETALDLEAKDPAPVPELSEVEVPRALAQEIRRAMKRYPDKRSATIPALWAVQRRYGWCTPEGIEQAAAVMGLTPSHLEAVASFYDLFHLEPSGKHEVLVCTNISCWLRGADEMLAAFKEAAGPGGSADGAGGPPREDRQAPSDVSVRGFECLGACDLAPMASIDERYYGPLEDGDAAAAVEQMRSREEVLPGKRLEDRGAAGGKRAAADKRITTHPLNKPTRPRPKRAPQTKRGGR
jgi:NADH-quinone oxidoreductase subunit E